MEFKLYVDEQGLGAKDVTQRRVMRFTCPRSAALYLSIIIIHLLEDTRKRLLALRRQEADLALGADGSAVPALETAHGVAIRSFECASYLPEWSPIMSHLLP